jgi:putative DNA primase/helicase
MSAAEQLKAVTPHDQIVEFALDYAQRGWHVFPCNPRNKAPFVGKDRDEAGNEIPKSGGLYKATTDADQIRAWWTRWPRAMIGVRMGAASGVWGLDPDAPKEVGDADGRQKWAKLQIENGQCPHTHSHLTPGDGLHLLFKYRADRPITNGEGKLTKSGINVRGEGGYVIAPPSARFDGKRYEIAEPLDFFSFAEAPHWLYDLILPAEPSPALQPIIFETIDSIVPRLPNTAYGKAAIDGIRANVAAAGKGQRNKALNSAAYNLAGFADSAGVSQADAEHALLGAATANGLVAEDGEQNVLAIIHSGWTNGLTKQRPIPPMKTARAQVETIDNGTITQDGVARVFAHRYADRLRYCHHAGAWYEWTGSHWQRDEMALAFQFARELGREFTAASNPAEVKEVRKITFAGGVEKFAKSDPALAVTAAYWDRDPYLLGTPGGTVDLRTGILREPDPADGISKITAVAPSRTAECPRWLAFLDETFGDAELIRFLQQWGGYCLTGDTKEHALLFGSGSGGNGKSVWLNAHTGILNDYATTAPMATFAASTSDRHETELAMLRGARMVTASETEEGRAWAEARIKQLTGGDPISARFMRQDHFTFKPQFKLTIIGNHKPVLKNVDDAQRRRFNLIPFNRKPAKPDRDLEAKLTAEWPDILRWLIDGCLDWQASSGLVRPAAVVAATDVYFEDQDLFSQWLADICDAEIGNNYKWEATGLLFASWSAYSTSAGEKPGSIKAFSAELVKRGFDRCSAGHAKTRGFNGIHLRKPIMRGDD